MSASDADAGDDRPLLGAETHVSWVFFAGDRCIKLYKPGRTDVLDASTIEARGELVREEVEVNRRFAPDVYLGAVELSMNGEIVDHAVMMQRMRADDRLSTRLTVAPLDERLELVRRVARRVAVIHAEAPVLTAEEATSVAGREALQSRMHADIRGLAEQASHRLAPSRIELLEALADQFLSGRAPLLERRIQQGRVIDGHGDLLTEDIFMTETGTQILDALAFDYRLRHGDVLADVAFLVMDLQRLGHEDAARSFIAAYHEFTGEQHPASLAHYYVAQRATVRAKVGALRANQTGSDAAWAAVDALTDLALDHLERSQVRLVLVGGIPGSGKSSVARALAEQTGWVHLESDEHRRDIGMSGVGAAGYTHSARTQVYDSLFDHARTLIGFGASVVLDATWSEADWRQQARSIADDSSAAVHEVRCVVPTDMARKRVAERAGSDSLSEATPDVVDRLDSAFEAWPEAITLDTSGPPDESATAVLRAVPGVAWNVDR